MTMSTFAHVLAKGYSGLYQLCGPAASVELKALCRIKQVELFHGSGQHVCSKQRFLATLARALHFPHWFGMNWDALFDSLTDFAWQEHTAHVLLLSGFGAFARHAPPEFAAALAVLADAAAFWEQRDVRFLVLIEPQRLPHFVRLPRLYRRL